MKKEKLYEIRTNTSLTVDYETLRLVPEIELIFLTSHPEYRVLTKKGEQYIEKSAGISETRITTSLSGVNKIIGQLQATAAALQTMDQLSAGLNSVIEQSRKQNNP